MALYILIGLVAFIIGGIVGVIVCAFGIESQLLRHAKERTTVRVKGLRFMLVRVSRQ